MRDICRYHLWRRNLCRMTVTSGAERPHTGVRDHAGERDDGVAPHLPQRAPIKMSGFCICIALVSGCASAASRFADDSSDQERLLSLDYGKLLLADTQHVLSAPLRWDRRDWLTVSLASLGVAATGLFDEPVRDVIADNKGKTADNIANFFEPFGVEYSFGVLSGFYLSGLAFDNPGNRAVALDGLAASLVATGIMTPVLKFAVGRSRPRTEDGAQTFEPFSGNASFPSSHTTQAFAVASVIAEHYDPLWIDLTSYGVASMAGFARIEEDEHWVSDVVASALIGTVVGKAVVRFNEQQRDRDAHSRTSASVMPLVGADALGLTVNFSF